MPRRLHDPKTSLQIFGLAGAGIILLILLGLTIYQNSRTASLIKPTATPSASPTPTPLSKSSSAQPLPAPTAALPVWSDEFDGPAGQAPSSHWNIDTGGDGWGNAEWEYYTASTRNAALDGAGHLVITARRPDGHPGSCDYGPCDITSARLQTDGTFATTYGRIEARIKTPAGQGLWPAFWMLSSDDRGEIDIMENNGRDPSTISGTAHVPGFTNASGLSTEYKLLPGNTASSAFHVYAVDWSPTSIKWSVDGHTYKTLQKSSMGGIPWVFDRPFYLLLNLAVGSDDPGYPDATTPFPAQLLIDYVRIYKYPS